MVLLQKEDSRRVTTSDTKQGIAEIDHTSRLLPIRSEYKSADDDLSKCMIKLAGIVENAAYKGFD